MDSYFSWRKTRADDLPACLALHPAKNGSEVVGSRKALRAWQRILEMWYATRSAVVELHSNGGSQIVGFGFSTFVTKSFAEAELRNPRPGLNSRIIQSVVDGNSVIARLKEVREANTRGELQQVNLDTSWKSGPQLSGSQINELRVLLGQAYPELYAGYVLSRIIMEIVDEMDLLNARNVRAFRLIGRFEAPAGADGTWYPERALIALDAATMRDDPLSVGAMTFHRQCVPQFGLTQIQQQLLELGLDGIDDAAAAKELNVSLPAVKHRWASIFERIAAVRPDLCPADVNRTRGIQKRQRVLSHLRKHPEELRPFDFRINGNRKATADRLPS